MSRVIEEIDGVKYEVLDSRISENATYHHKVASVNINGSRGVMYFSTQAFEDMEVEDGKKIQFFVFKQQVLMQVNNNSTGIHCTIEKKNATRRKSFKITSALITRQLLQLAGEKEFDNCTYMIFKTLKELNAQPLWEINLKVPLKKLEYGKGSPATKRRKGTDSRVRDGVLYT